MFSKYLVKISLLLTLIANYAYAQEDTELSKYLENLGLIYEDKTSKDLQEFWLLGRYHGQFYYNHSNQKDFYDYETRRFRLGAQAKLYNKLTLHVQMLSGTDLSPFYNGFTELWAQWNFTKELILTLGQQKHRFTHDRNVSSRYLNYLERAMLTNMFRADYTPGVTLQGSLDDINYYTGIFSNSTQQNMKEALTNYDSGSSFIFSMYKDIEVFSWADNDYFYFSYLYSDANKNATNLDLFDQGLSSAIIVTDNALSLVTEATAGFDNKQGNAYGINFQPGIFLTDNIQLVGRYQVAFSTNENGLIPQARYEQRSNLLPNDTYQAGYVGLNYYLAKHRLKIMTGIEYANMGSQDVLTYSTMLRFYFGPHSGGAFPMNQVLKGYLFDFD